MPLDQSHGAPQRIAVIGGGISGMVAAYTLAERHQVVLIEAEPRLGGHARTVLAGKDGNRPVDTGFIVFNYVNYPHLTRLFEDLNVPVQKSDMSFGVSLDAGRVEYALRSGNALFGQRRNLFRPGFHRMILDILRFNAQAEPRAMGRPGLTIGALLDELRLSTRFREDYLYPLCGAIWSTSRHDMASFPAEALIRFLRNHGLMQAKGQPQWWTVRGGSVEYVRRLQAALQARAVDLRLGQRVGSVRRSALGVSLQLPGAGELHVDQVVFACHADQALALLADPSPAEHAALSAVRFQDNETVLHADPRVMPDRRRCWSSWVYRDGLEQRPGIGVSYWMNRLQAIPEDDPLFVTLNPDGAIDPALVYDRVTFRHPLFDRAALQAQNEIAAMQGENSTWFAGAWLRNGFHEDGCATALRVARGLGCGAAFEPSVASPEASGLALA